MSSQPVFEFYSANRFREYPFDKKQPDELHRLLVDAYVVHTNEKDNQTRLRMISFDPAGDLELRFEDGTLLAALTGADGFIASTFGIFTLYEWRRATTTGVGFTGVDLVARLVVLTEELDNFAFPVAPADAFILGTRVNPRMEIVRRQALAFPELACCLGGPNRKGLELEAGFNIELAEQQEAAAVGLALGASAEVRDPTTVVISASPGLGRGAFPVCENPAGVIRSINRTRPNDQQDFRLGASDCTWDETRLVGGTSAPVSPNTDYLGGIVGALDKIILQLHQACRACCDCPDYANAYQTIKTTFERAKTLRDRLETINSDCETIAAQWETERADREIGMEMRLRTISRPDYLVAIAVQVGNSSRDTVPATTLTIDADTDAGYIDGSGYLEAEGIHNSQVNPSGTGPFTVALPQIEPGKYAVFRMAVRYTGATVSRKDRLVNIDVTAVSGSTSRNAVKATKLLEPLQKS